MALRAIYSCIPRKRAIQYYYYYLYRALCVILLKRNKAFTQHGNTNALVFNILNILQDI